MDISLLQVLRFVHIVSASFWVGCAVTLGFFVNPALLNGEIGGARTLKSLMLGRKLGTWLPIAVLVALASGIWLYRIDFTQMSGGTFTKRQLDYTLGAFLGVLAFIVGVSINLPTGGKIAALADFVGTGTPTADQSNELVRLSKKLIVATRSTAILTLGAAGLMALARFAQ
ncbi:MAG: hypothetical protein M3Z17_07210 [Gemmatimonadota bacterium]|nr:hypothetical protein [Gemmatimonadota bacterium]